jgi:hypothetical protein
MKEWSPEVAYAVGLIVSDGSLSRDGRHIDFTSKDLQLIKTFQACLGVEHIKIGVKQNGSGKQCYRLQFGDVNLYRWLQSVGIGPCKSKVIRSVNVPPNFFPDFLRGVFDGDGTIYATNDKRWQNSTLISLGFSSGSVIFLEWLKKQISSILPTTGYISNGKNVLQLRYGKKDSLLIFKCMFYKETLPHLQRKFTKAKKVFRMGELQ